MAAAASSICREERPNSALRGPKSVVSRMVVHTRVLHDSRAARQAPPTGGTRLGPPASVARQRRLRRWHGTSATGQVRAVEPPDGRLRARLGSTSAGVHQLARVAPHATRGAPRAPVAMRRRRLRARIPRRCTGIPPQLAPLESGQKSSARAKARGESSKRDASAQTRRRARVAHASWRRLRANRPDSCSIGPRDTE